MPEKILVRGVNWIGDAVMTMPALRALRKAYPETHISLLVKPAVAPIFAADPCIDEVLQLTPDFSGLKGSLLLSAMIRKQGFSCAILFQNSFTAALIAFLSSIPKRIGYNSYHRGHLLTHPVKFSKKGNNVHHIIHYLNILIKTGIEAEYSLPWLQLRLEERLKARDIINNLRMPVIGINPGAAYGSAKRWPPERFAAVIRKVITELGGSAVIFGGRTETAIAEEIVNHLCMKPSFSGRILSMAGRTSIRELAALIAECDVLLSNDSGPMHIGYAVKTPLVAIFGSTDKRLTGPPENGNIVIDKNVACSPCFKRTCSSMDCMDSISAEEVFTAVKKLCPGNKAVFFDRDGTLCRDADYLKNWDDFEILPGMENLKTLKNAGFRLIGVTNQSGIGRKLVDENFVAEVNSLFIEKFSFDDFYYCPHLPEDHCRCRKPEPGMLLEARYRHRLNLKKSYVIGDKDSDMEAARSVGARGILIRTGKHKESPYADYIAEDMKEASDYIIRDNEK